MRTLAAGERTRLAAARLNIYTKVEVQDADLAWKNVSLLGPGSAIDFFDSARWSDDLDAPVMGGTVSLRREASVSGTTYSLSPLLQASTLNRNAAAAYAPLLDAGRGIRITTAVTDPGVAPVAGDWKEVFLGKIDKVDWKGSESVVALTIRDDGALLLDTYIEAKRTYGTAGGVAVQTVMQSILDDNLGAGVVTLYVPTSPGWNITTYEQEQTNVMEAIRALALQIGWDVRYRYDASNVFRLTFYGPDRTKTVADATFGPTEYLEVPVAEVADADVRNAGRLWYTDGATKARLSASATNPTSITRFKRRFLEFEEAAGGNIDSAAEANVMLAAALSDLSTPVFEHEIETFYWWPAQMGDLFEFLSNSVHYDTAYKLAVASLAHELTSGHGRTSLRCRGQPAGAYRDWLRRGKVNGGPSDVTPGAPVVLGFTVTMRDDGTLLVRGLGNDEAASWRLTIRTDRPPTDAEVRAGATIAGRDLLFDSTGVTTYAEGQTAYAGAFAYQGASATGLESAAPSAQGQAMRNVSDYPVAAIVQLSADSVQEDLRLTGTLGLHGGGPIQYRYKIDTSLGPGTFSGWAVFPDGSGAYDDLTINRHKTHTMTVVLEVRDVLLHVASTEHTVGPWLPALASITGLIDEAAPTSQGHVIARGFMEGTGQNGATVDLSAGGFNSPPRVDIWGGVSHEPRNASFSGGYNAALPQEMVRRAQNVTEADFDIEATQVQRGTPTAQLANFPASNLMTNVADDEELVTNPAPSNDNLYTVRYTVSVTTNHDAPGGESASATVVVAIEADVGGWTEYASFPYTRAHPLSGTTSWLSEVKQISVTGMTNASKIRLLIKSFVDTDTLLRSTFTVHGKEAADATDGASWTTATDSVATATPLVGTAQIVVNWRAQEVSL